MLIDWIALTVLLIGLAVLAAIDARTQRLPDVLTLPLLVLGMFYSFGSASLGTSLAGAALGYLSLAGISAIYLRLRGQHGLGLGDAKLFAVAGAWLGWPGLAPVLLIGSASALGYVLLFRRRSEDAKIAFGPFLAIGIALVVIWTKM